jgi:hypothetical protein
MTKHIKSAFRSSTFWSGALASALVGLLVLAAAGVSAQAGGDPRSNDAPPVVTDQPERGDPAASGEPMFEPPAVAPLAATAAINTSITYQGVLKDGAQPANGGFDLRFRLFDDPAAGVQLGEQVAAEVAVADGQFAVPLDFGPAAYSAQAVWLEIAVSPAGAGTYETLTPRQAITPAPLALGLPNVTTDPNTGRVSIGGGTAISSFEVFGINREIDGWVGMYITGGGPNARPFYGYATDDSGSFGYAWTEYNGADDEWQLYTVSGNVFAVSNGGDVRASGDFSQPATADGLVKAAAFVECWPDTALLAVARSFNSITGAPVTAAVGPAQGQCYVNFGFNLTGRFFSATAVQAGVPRGVTCDVDGSNPNRLFCMRWRLVDAGAEGWGGRIMITIY